METKNKRGRPRIVQAPTNKRIPFEQCQVDALSAASEKLGVSVSALIRKFVDQGLAQCT